MAAEAPPAVVHVDDGVAGLAEQASAAGTDHPATGNGAGTTVPEEPPVADVRLDGAGPDGGYDRVVPNGDVRLESVPLPAVLDGAPVDTAAPGSLAAVVAAHLAAPAPGAGGTGGDERAQAAQAVLDVLRASGWSDVTETLRLRSEVERLRELLDLVVRDHRARVAVAASGQDEQAHWLVPLLRAAHGVAFGTLGAKVHLRTAVQDLPPGVLASAGLQIEDHGPAPEPDAYR